MKKYSIELMEKIEHLKVIGEALLKKGTFDVPKVCGIVDEVKMTWLSILDNLELIAKKAGLSVEEICEATDLTYQQYLRRKTDINKWEIVEVEKLMKAIQERYNKGLKAEKKDHKKKTK